MIPASASTPVVATGHSGRQIVDGSGAQPLENTDSGASFGEVLDSQAGTVAVDAAGAGSSPVTDKTGKPLQSGGKNLPELPLPEEVAGKNGAITEELPELAVIQGLAVDREAIADTVAGTNAAEHIPEHFLPAHPQSAIAGVAPADSAQKGVALASEGVARSVADKSALPASFDGHGSFGEGEGEARQGTKLPEVPVLRREDGQPFRVQQNAIGAAKANTEALLMADGGELTQRGAGEVVPAADSGAALQRGGAGGLSPGVFGGLVPVNGVGSAAGSKAVSSTATGMLPVSVNDPGWGDQFAGRVSVIVKQGMQEANLQLSPPDMGKLEIRITTDGDQTRMLFTVQNASAREAIEQAMPKLKDMLEQGGLELAHSEVADHSQSRHRDGETNDGSVSRLGVAESAEHSEAVADQPVAVVSDALVDYFI